MRLLDWLLYPFRTRAVMREIYKDVPMAKSDGSQIPWRPGYYLWSDGTERRTPPPRSHRTRG